MDRGFQKEGYLESSLLCFILVWRGWPLECPVDCNQTRCKLLVVIQFYFYHLYISLKLCLKLVSEKLINLIAFQVVSEH